MRAGRRFWGMPWIGWCKPARCSNAIRPGKCPSSCGSCQFQLYMNDGLLSGRPPDRATENTVVGVLAENYVAQTLAAGLDLMY